MSDAPKKRIRRTAEEARRLILDAAEERLANGGPEALRLQDIAADVGISHPAILHHFESRDGLVLALTVRTLQSLRDGLLEVLAEVDLQNPNVEAVLASVFGVLSDRGLARLIAWVVLSGRLVPDAVGNSEEAELLKDISDALHALRLRAAEDHDIPAGNPQDTMFIVYLVAAAAFGDAVFGLPLIDGFGIDPDDQPQVQQDFRTWFASLISDHLTGGVPAGENQS